MKWFATKKNRPVRLWNGPKNGKFKQKFFGGNGCRKLPQFGVSAMLQPRMFAG